MLAAMFAAPQSIRHGTLRVATIVSRFLPPLPPPLLAPLQPLLARLMDYLLRRRPELPDRLDDKTQSRIRIDAKGLPFSLVLRLDPTRPLLRAVPLASSAACDARIAGDLVTLMDMVDGELDGDALFFSRAISIEGDTEAVVRLRNALDDLDGSILDDVADFFGPPGRLLLARLRDHQRSRDQETRI